MSEFAFRVFLGWKLTLLANRDLKHADQRALHQYRLSDEEFADLEQLLRKWLGLLQEDFKLRSIPELPGFSALFVLFAAEWWRRRFDGGHWSWDPILNAIGADPAGWSQVQRSKCIQYGLREWGLEPSSVGGLRFLGSVAVQGGLPQRLLADDRGGIGHLLGQVLTQANGTAVTQSDLLTWIESLQGMLPKSYRQTAIVALLANTAWTVLKLKEEGGLTPGVDAIAMLDAKVPAWRDRFPLRLDDDHARGLIERLIKDAALVRTQRGTIPIAVERRIIPGASGDWTLQSIATLPESIGAKELATLFRETMEELPRFADLSLAAGSSHTRTTLRRLAGQERYRIERAAWGLAGESASHEHMLRLASPDGRLWSAHAPKGEALDDELPWVFGDEDQSHRFLRQGTGSVAAMEALVAVPDGWRTVATGDSTLAADGKLSVVGREVLRLHGVVEIQDLTGNSYRVRTGHAGAADESIEWRGERVWLDFLSPAMAFKGRPHVYRVDDEGHAHQLDGAVSWSIPGTQQPTGRNYRGPIVARYPSTGETRHRCRFVSLPEMAELKLIPRNATTGGIQFAHWGASAAKVVSAHIGGTTEIIDDTLTLNVTMPSGVPTPEQIDIEVSWQGVAVPVRLRVPFPARGARLFDEGGRECPSGTNLCVQRLAGTRLLVLSEVENVRMTLEIHGPAGQMPRIHSLRSLPGAFGVQVRLQDYATDIQHLLAFDDSPDAKVRVALRIGGAEHFKLHVARYAARLELASPDARLDGAAFSAMEPEVAEALPMLALRLERPGDEPVSLVPRKSNGVATGTWEFLSQTREPGAWLIYPGRGASLPVRPTLWPVAGSVATDTPLALAIGLADRTNREAALDACLISMAGDFRDPSWVEVDRLVNLIGHLPLATLDLWRRFSQSSDAMAALAFRFSSLPASFLARFSEELPFAWECVSFASWVRAMACLQLQLTETFGEESGSAVLATFLDSRVDALSSVHPSLASLLGIASSTYRPDARKQTQALRMVGMVSSHLILFDGPDCEMMKLRQRRANDEWPQGLTAVLDRSASVTLIKEIGCQKSHQFADSVINLPVALAADVASNTTKHWFDSPALIQILRTHYAFDPEWFDAAFTRTIARCLGRGLLDP